MIILHLRAGICRTVDGYDDPTVSIHRAMQRFRVFVEGTAATRASVMD